MPTYQYRCTDCFEELETVQRFTDDSLTTCPECAGSLRKVFSPVGVVFKGSGFYATDSRSKGKANAAAPAGSSSSGSSSKSDAKGQQPAKAEASSASRSAKDPSPAA